MKMAGRRETATAPITILVLNRAPSCSLLRSTNSRTMLRMTIRPKISSAAMMKLETAYKGMTSRQDCGSKGTSSEPRVKTAARRSGTNTPPRARPTRRLWVDWVIENPQPGVAGGGAKRIWERGGAGGGRRFCPGGGDRGVNLLK